MNRRLAVLSTGRQDWGILRGVCGLLRDDAAWELCLMLGGMHESELFGRTRDVVISEGFHPAAELAWIPDGAKLDPERQAGDAVWMVARALREHRASALMLVGDRFETASAALGATLARVPIVHLHGGEETLGAYDNAFRHAVTKLSHLHFTSHPRHTERVIAMGEDPATVCTVGAPGLDNLWRTDLPDRGELESFLGIALDPPVVLVTLHPITIGSDPATEAKALTAAMDAVEATYIITLPNADHGNEVIRDILVAAGKAPRRRVVEALGERRFWGLLRRADAMLGNSSSALIEAPVVGLPAVNVGDRQKGRLRAANVIDAPADRVAVVTALQRALTAAFRAEAVAGGSLYGDGRASERIVARLQSWNPPMPPVKTIYP